MRKRPLLGVTASVFAMLTGLSGQAFAQTPTGSARPDTAPASANPAPAVDNSYVLGSGDIVDIGLVGRESFGRVRVSTDGTILLPLIGRIHAADRTVIELSDDVRQALIKGGFYSDPVVRADVVSISSRYVTILGNVGSPGLLPLDKNYHLSEILARVGGRSANGADYVLLTPANSETSQKYWLNQLATGGGAKDPFVHAGDKIFVPSAESELFYISGQVNKPGGYPVTQGLTVRLAIAMGGGVNENGSENKVKIVRDGKTLKNIKLEDPIKVGDVVTIGERLF